MQEESKRGTHGGDRLMYILGKAAPDQVLKAIEQKSKHPVARVCRSHGGRQGYQRIPYCLPGYYSWRSSEDPADACRQSSEAATSAVLILNLILVLDR